jgi:hypothetical protein
VRAEAQTYWQSCGTWPLTFKHSNPQAYANASRTIIRLARCAGNAVAAAEPMSRIEILHSGRGNGSFSRMSTGQAM